MPHDFLVLMYTADRDNKVVTITNVVSWIPRTGQFTRFVNAFLDDGYRVMILDVSTDAMLQWVNKHGFVKFTDEKHPDMWCFRSSDVLKA